MDLKRGDEEIGGVWQEWDAMSTMRACFHQFSLKDLRPFFRVSATTPIFANGRCV
jgi:hypothetical protein